MPAAGALLPTPRALARREGPGDTMNGHARPRSRVVMARRRCASPHGIGKNRAAVDTNLVMHATDEHRGPVARRTGALAGSDITARPPREPARNRSVDLARALELLAGGFPSDPAVRIPVAPDPSRAAA